jgi:hypothetical protein
MTSVDYSAKMTGHEAKVWIKNCLEAVGYDHGEDFIEFIQQHKPRDFKAPRKARASKKSSSERAGTGYDCQLCDGRVWNDSLGAQCTRKKNEGECLCTIHLKEAMNNDGSLRNGYYNDERPTHAYGDEAQAQLAWHDVEVPEKVKKTPAKKSSGEKTERKCGNCGECGHNRKTCPSLKTDSTVEDKKKMMMKKKKMMEKMAAELAEMEKDTEPVDEVEEVVKEVAKEYTESVVEDAEQGVAELVEALDDLELEEDTSTTISFEGVTYTFDREDGNAYDVELEEVGSWDGTTIKFIDTTQAKLHRIRKFELKNE